MRKGMIRKKWSEQRYGGRREEKRKTKCEAEKETETNTKGRENEDARIK